MDSEENKELTIGDFRFASDKTGRLIPVPSDLYLHGYIGREGDCSDYARIQIPKASDPDELFRFSQLWKTVYEAKNTSVFTEILDLGEDDGIPYYTSKFPHGEPLSQYLENSPPWPGKMAARVIGKFIASLGFQGDIPMNIYTISYDSLWIEKTIYGPRLLIGDISLHSGPSASADNGALMLSVFKDLTKEERPDPVIAKVFKKLSQGPVSLGIVEKALKQFSIAGDSRDLPWTAESDPTPWLETCLAKVDLASVSNLYETKDTTTEKKNPAEHGRSPANQTFYRPAVELDHTAKSFQIPRRLVRFSTAAAFTVLFFAFGLFTNPGKSLFDEISGLFGGMAYEPLLVLPPRTEENPPQAQTEGTPDPTNDIDLSTANSENPITVIGVIIDKDGLVKGSFESVDSYSSSDLRALERR